MTARHPVFQLAERWPVLAYHVGVDGIAIVFILVAALLHLPDDAHTA